MRETKEELLGLLLAVVEYRRTVFRWIEFEDFVAMNVGQIGIVHQKNRSRSNGQHMLEDVY